MLIVWSLAVPGFAGCSTCRSLSVLYTVIGARVNKRLPVSAIPCRSHHTIRSRTVDDLPPVTEPSYTSAAEEPAYETQIDPDDDMEIDDPGL